MVVVGGGGQEKKSPHGNESNRCTGEKPVWRHVWSLKEETNSNKLGGRCGHYEHTRWCNYPEFLGRLAYCYKDTLFVSRKPVIILKPVITHAPLGSKAWREEKEETIVLFIFLYCRLRHPNHPLERGTLKHWCQTGPLCKSTRVCVCVCVYLLKPFLLQDNVWCRLITEDCDRMRRVQSGGSTWQSSRNVTDGRQACASAGGEGGGGVDWGGGHGTQVRLVRLIIRPGRRGLGLARVWWGERERGEERRRGNRQEEKES